MDHHGPRLCAFPRTGLAPALLKNRFDHFQSKHSPKVFYDAVNDLIHIEVYEGNPLIPLLMKHDFHEFARQERFAKDESGYHTRILFESFL